MYHDTLDLHSLMIDVDNIDAAVNAAYGFGASLLIVRTLLFNLSSLFTYLLQILQHSMHPNLNTICFMQCGRTSLWNPSQVPRMQRKIPIHRYYFNYAFYNSTCMLLIIRNFLIVSLCFVMQHDICSSQTTFFISDLPL